MTRNRHQTKAISSTLVDIIVVSGGRFDMLKKCLEALEKQEDVQFNVYVIDNASDNKEKIHFKDIYEKEIITDSKRLAQEEGFPKANNIGARMGNSPLILFLNDDVELKSDALKQMVNTMDNPDIGIVGAKLTFPDDVTSPIRPAGKVQHVGMAMNINGDLVHPLVGWKSDNPKCNVSREVIAVTGACLMVRRNLWNKIGGFWEGYGLGTYEDAELNFAVQQLGKKVYVNVNAQGTHYTGATAEKKQRPYPLQQNALTFRARWGASGLFKYTEWQFL